ncbi:hypothetical protein LTR66_010965, partial [Elasticomyces elasticus]
MDGPIATHPTIPDRPEHRRTKSSKSSVLKAMIMKGGKKDAQERTGPANPRPVTRDGSQPSHTSVMVPLLPADHPHSRVNSRVLGEVNGNSVTTAAIVDKNVDERYRDGMKMDKFSDHSAPDQRERSGVVTSNTDKAKTEKRSKHSKEKSAKKSKSSTSLSAVFAKMNRSSKDLHANVAVKASKDKENTTPPATSNRPATTKAGGTEDTPIWAQLATSRRPTSPSDSKARPQSSRNVEEEIALYTPVDYSPSKQRNFAHGNFVTPSLRHTSGPRAGRARPQSAYIPSGPSTAHFLDTTNRRVSSDRVVVQQPVQCTTSLSRTSSFNSLERYQSNHRSSQNDDALPQQTRDRDHTKDKGTRKASNSSAEQPPPEKGGLAIAKRGARVMAAVAAFNSRSKEQPLVPPAAVSVEPALDKEAVEKAFEGVLDSRNIPEPMRQKMRSLTLRVKADFVRQNGDSTGSANACTGKVCSSVPARSSFDSTLAAATRDADEAAVEHDQQETGPSKRSRPRSRNFTFTKKDKNSKDASPSKKCKEEEQSRPRPTSVYVPKSTSSKSPSGQRPLSRSSSLTRSAGNKTTIPEDFVAYLKNAQDPKTVEVGRLHKLRLLLRNETVAWVDNFISLGGMAEIVQLLHRIMAVEWREEHEDQLLHEALLCLKGLCTTDLALRRLADTADVLFPALLAMLFSTGEEKKGPAEFATRTIIINILFAHLTSALSSEPATLERRARSILEYLQDPQKASDARSLEWVTEMHRPRPYRVWCREVSNVSKEVFWIFLHRGNTVPLPTPDEQSAQDTPSSADAPQTTPDTIRDGNPTRAREPPTFTQRHFPAPRPPVPAAPYIGG